MPKPKRKELRLKEYDYSQLGVYFLTICTHNRQNILSSVCVGGGVLDAPLAALSDYVKIAETVIENINKNYPHTEISKYVIMPNHIHMLIEAENSVKC